MVFGIATFITDAISRSGYFGLFFLMTGESALLPIPSEIVLPFAGFLVFSGKITFFSAVLIAILGQLFGSIISYFVGYYGGRRAVLKYGKYIHLKENRLEQVEGWFRKYGTLAIFFTRLMPIIRTVISFPAGMAKMKFSKFLFYSALGIIPWTIIFVYFGYTLGEHWQSIIATFDKFQLVVLIGIFALIGYWIWKVRNKNK